MFIQNKNRGFTLIELLVVIAIIGLLSSVVLVNVNTSRTKSRDAKRAQDMHQIYLAINLYYDKYGCLPTTSGSTCPGIGSYSEADLGGWDYSSQGGFMTFLQTAGFIPQSLVDPKNNMTGDGSPAGTYAYRYYCYPNGPHLGYWRESDGAYKYVLGSASSWTDVSYICK